MAGQTVESMSEMMVIDGDSREIGKEKKNSAKRKRVKLSTDDMALTPEEREAKIRVLNEELLNLCKYFRESVSENRGIMDSHYAGCSSSNMHAMVALLLEEKSASYTRLVSEIYEKAKEKVNNVNIGSVKSTILSIGRRCSYGVPTDESDVLEDETVSCLWCWETRDMKLLPKSLRGDLKVRRTCRQKIRERITAIHYMLLLLQTTNDCQNYKNDLRKASEKLSKVSNESNIRLLVESLKKINCSERSEMETKKEEKALAKQLEKKRYEEEKEKKKMDRQLQKEKMQKEKEMKRLQEEAEKEEKRREREDTEMRKQLKRKQNELERFQRRREKEESEQKKNRSLQKQALIIDRFLHKNKKAMIAQSKNEAVPSISLSKPEKMHESVTVSMDSALLHKEQIVIEEMRKSHLNSWHHLGSSIRSRSGQHWGLRRKPKTALVNDLKLISSNGMKEEEELKTETAFDDQACNSNINFVIQKCRRSKQLLQFDKSNRPAFYGVWPKISNTVGPRNPYKKDPELDYDVDSDEDWEEDEPGESLSDCDNDEEEILEEGFSKAEDGDESDDGFFVPDGYLSESGGVQSEGSPCRIEEDENGTSSRTESEDISSWVRQIKHLHKLTDHALSKNQPLIITNIKHENANLLYSDNLTATSKMEHLCLEALAMRSLPNGFIVEIHSDDVQENEEALVSTSKSKSLLVGCVKGIPDSDLPKIVDSIGFYPYSMKKILEILLPKFPNCSKSQLKNKVHQISHFADNKWQVKKEILNQLGLSNSPAKSGSKMKSISTFFYKGMPPSEKQQPEGKST